MNEDNSPYGSDDDLFADLDQQSFPTPEEIRLSMKRYQLSLYQTDIDHIPRSGLYISTPLSFSTTKSGMHKD